MIIAYMEKKILARTCFSTQLLPESNNRKSRSKENVCCWSQYPKIHLHNKPNIFIKYVVIIH